MSYPMADAAALIGISERYLWTLVRLRRIKSFRLGQRRLISRSALEAFVAQREAVEAGEEVA